MQRWVVACSLALLLCAVFADECPDGGHCKDGDTCCHHPSNGYQCCPFDQAECCGDHVHCCPAGMTCDVNRSRCVNANVTVPWTARTPTEQPRLSKSFRMIKSYVGEDDDNICPDRSRCPAEFSCLRSLTKYGCCPLAQGIPCSDGKHCCPQSHTCTEDSRSCIKKDVASTVLCGDGVYECPEESSCCEGADGQFSCCPMPKSVCCDDKVHCCPEGSLCDLETFKCTSISSKKQLPMWAKFAARRRAEWENQKEEQLVTSEAATSSESEEGKAEALAAGTDAVASPGERASVVQCNSTEACPDETTCCETPSEGWGCCPIPNAVCCSDHIHCCPRGTVCDLKQQKCVEPSDAQTTPMIQSTPAFFSTASSTPEEIQHTKSDQSEKTESEKAEEDEDDEDMEHRVPYAVASPGERASVVQCNSTEACPDETTCCETPSEGWGCCPIPNAVCCSDHIHCCPHRTVCDLKQQKCVDLSDAQATPMIQSTPAFFTTAWITPAETQYAGSDQSEEAKPKEDEEDEEDEDDDDEDWEHRVSYAVEQASYVQCNSTVACPGGTTCCQTLYGEWGCCGVPDGVCCNDHTHCCPQGTVCNLEKQECTSSSDAQSTSMIQRSPAAPSTTVEIYTESGPSEEAESEEDDEDEDEDGEDEEEEDDEDYDDDEDVDAWVPCKGHKRSACHRNFTCCPSKHRKHYCCCPLPKAKCCRDGMHCCPKGYKCCPKRQTCVKDSLEIPWYTKLPALANPNPKQIENQIVETVTIEWTESDDDEEEGDGEDDDDGETTKVIQEDTTTATTPDQSELTEREDDDEWEDDEDDDDDTDEDDEDDEDDVVHCDQKVSCPKGYSCCKCGDQWGCCPLPEAVCCSDGKHCCPRHHRCSETHQACVGDNDVAIPWYTKRPALSGPETGPDNDKRIKCSDGRSCLQYETCCQLSSGEYGCCPIENAVCCSDKKHCCPTDYTCDLSTGNCMRSVVLEVKFVPLTPAKPTGQKCGRYTCDDTEKCCMNRGMPHCCKFKDGVCCNTRTCCRAGEQCKAEGGCTSASKSSWDRWMFLFKREEKNPGVL